MKVKYLSISACALLATFTFSGCGGGSGSSAAVGSSSGVLSMNPNLANVDYNCGQGRKQTTASGAFNYNVGDECTFYIGGAELKITPNSNEISTQILADANGVDAEALDDYFRASGVAEVNGVLAVPSSYKTETASFDKTVFTSKETIKEAIRTNTSVSATKRKEYSKNIAEAEFEKQIEFANRLDVKFENIGTPTTDATKETQQASSKVTVNGSQQTIGYSTLLKTGEMGNGEIFGLAKDYTDAPITFSDVDSSPYICNGTNDGVGSGLDFTSFLNVNGKLYMVSQFECQIGAMYMAELTQDTNTGALSVDKNTLKFISQKNDFGGFVHCAGMKTPWESHLGSEEYENDARDVETDADAQTGLTGNKYYDETAKYWGGDATRMSPYYYGWTPEVLVDNNGNAFYTKHYSMGRFSHEVAYVMPDNKTVYLSDDGTNVGLFMFVADTEKDLSSGTLYAAKWNQTSSEGAGEADITWINLGHSTNSSIKSILNNDGNVNLNDAPVFSDIFDVAEADTDNSCPSTYTSINTSAGHECLKLKTTSTHVALTSPSLIEEAASRLETRRYAALKGATTEFRKEEGITFDAARGKLYVAMSEVAKGMLDDDSNDTGGNNDIRLEKNSCGAVYSMDVTQSLSPVDTDNVAISSAYVVENMKSILEGSSKSYDSDSDYANNTCDVNKISNPDNITFLPNSDILTIGEDTSSHENNVVWAYNVKTDELTRTFTTPLDAETTSPFWYTDLANGFGYLSVVTQHPMDDQGVDADKESAIGYVGPFKNLTTIKSFQKVGSYNTATEGGTEIVDFESNTMFTTNGANNTLDISSINPNGTVSFIRNVDLSSFGSGVQSVTVKNGNIALAVGSANKVTTRGKVVIFDTNGQLVSQTNVGYLPDMVTFNEAGTKVIVANEGEPDASSGTYEDVPGTIGVITLASADTSDNANGYAEVDFLTATLTNATDGTSVRLGGTPVDNKYLDIEPEYITVSGNYAYVTLQENNAVAKVDISGATPSLVSVKSLGAKDHSLEENSIDIEENSLIEMKTFTGLYGLYMPDSIASYTVDNSTYLVTANEGDGREYLDSSDEDVFVDEKKIKKLDLDSAISADYVNDDDLKVMVDLGDTDLDGDYDKLFTYGARSFSIWDENLDLVFDSKNHLSKLTEKYMPTLFNQDEGEMDGRSGNKGVEPEALTVGTINGKTYAFVGLERQSVIVVYDITTPTDAKFVKYISTETDGDISPEGMKFVDASNSPTGKPLLLVAYEVSGSTSVYEITMDSTRGTAISLAP